MNKHGNESMVYLCLFPNKKVYVGCTCDINKRIQAHLNTAKKVSKMTEKEEYWGYNKPFYDELEKEKKNVKWYILEENIPEEKCTEREQYWIDYYDAMNSDKGYNHSRAKACNYKYNVVVGIPEVN